MKETSRLLPFLPDFSSFFPIFPDFSQFWAFFSLSGVALCPPCHPSGYATGLLRKIESLAKTNSYTKL